MTTSKFKTCRTSFKKSIVIAIDGPAGSGKSTVAKLLAKHLQFLYLDTGAMYRAATLAAKLTRVNFLDTKALIRAVSGASIQLRKGQQGNLNVLLNGRLVNSEIRKPLITSLVSIVARIAQIRKIMVRLQRQISQHQDCVVEGRDIGSVVFPHAFIKFYLDASLEERARRRFLELKEKNLSRESLSKVQRLIKQRDHNDLTRSCGPLKKSVDALYLDTTGLSITQVVNLLLRHIDKKIRKLEKSYQ